MQQQYLALSPMPGQEFTGAGTSSNPSVITSMPSHGRNSSITAQLMDQTPTTTSMLAALQGTHHPQHSSGYHPLAQASSYDNGGFYGAGEAPGYGDYSGSFDMAFLNGDAGHNADGGHSPAAASVSSSSASIAELAAGVAATGVGSEAGDSPLVQRRGSDEGLLTGDVKNE